MPDFHVSNVVVTGRTPDTNLFSAGLVTPEASAVTSSPSSGCIEPGGSHVNITSESLIETLIHWSHDIP